MVEFFRLMASHPEALSSFLERERSHGITQAQRSFPQVVHDPRFKTNVLFPFPYPFITSVSHGRGNMKFTSTVPFKAVGF